MLYLFWFGLSLYSQLLHTRANQAGTYCLKWIPNHYKYPSQRRESNSQTAELKTTALATQPQLAVYLFCLCYTTINVPLPSSFLKKRSREFCTSSWQSRWNNTTKGRYTFQFFKEVSIDRLIGDYLLNLFFSNRGPFPSFKFYIGKSLSPSCICGSLGDSLHYITNCPLTSQFHIRSPSSTFSELWFNNLATSSFCHTRIRRLVSWLLSHETDILPTQYFLICFIYLFFLNIFQLTNLKTYFIFSFKFK